MLLSFNLGQEIKKACDEDLLVEEEIGPMRVDLPDGTYVRGIQMRNSKYLGEAEKKLFPNDYLNVLFNPSSYREDGHFLYSFEIKKDILIPENPKIFQIKSYVTINDIEGDSKISVIRPQFDKSLRKFKGFYYTKKAIT